MMGNEGESQEALEQVQELQHQLQEVLECHYPPHDPETHQNWTHHPSPCEGQGLLSYPSVCAHKQCSPTLEGETHQAWCQSIVDW